MPRLLMLPAALSAALAAPGFALAQDKSAELHGVMSKSMQEMQSMQMTGDMDTDFANELDGWMAQGRLEASSFDPGQEWPRR